MAWPNDTPQTGQGTSAPAHSPVSGAVGGGGIPGLSGLTQTPGMGTGAMPPGYDNLQALGNLFGSAVLGPNQAMGDYQMGNLQDQLGLLFASGQYQGDLAQQQAGFTMQNLGLDQSQLGIQQGALNRQNALLPQQQALVDQVFGLQRGALDRQSVNDPAEQALIDQMFGQNTAQLADSADQSHKANLSAATARGAVGAEGVQNRDRNIDVQHMYSQSSLNNQMDREHLQYGEKEASLKDAYSYLANQQQGQQLSYQERLAQNEDAQKQLGIASQRLGISGQEVQSRLQGALNQLGISTSLSVDQLLQEANKIQEGQLSPLSNLIAEIYAQSGIPLPGGGANGPTGTTGGGQTIQKQGVS